MAPVILVTGGAGYIGSHSLRALGERGRGVLVLDDMSEGHRSALQGAPLVEGSLLDQAFLARVFEDHAVEAVLHFAARCYVGESMSDPGRYYRINVQGTLNLLEAMARAGVRRLVFSSSCAVYGIPESLPIVESNPTKPLNTYGQTKLVVEEMLRDYHRAHRIDSVALRYFNAAGADPSGGLGEDHRPETHLIPLVLQAALGRRGKVTVFGDGYPTRDGTCIRDYIHVSDLAHAHVLALEYLEGGGSGARAFNLGNSQGTSVLEVIRAAERVTGVAVPFEVGPPRPGDPPVLVGSSDRIEAELGWKPLHGDIDAIVRTAWRWHRDHPEGYGV
jgi:UDP-glucose-4-epimerase GalE